MQSSVTGSYRNCEVGTELGGQPAAEEGPLVVQIAFEYLQDGKHQMFEDFVKLLMRSTWLILMHSTLVLKHKCT